MRVESKPTTSAPVKRAEPTPVAITKPTAAPIAAPAPAPTTYSSSSELIPVSQLGQMPPPHSAPATITQTITYGNASQPAPAPVQTKVVAAKSTPVKSAPAKPAPAKPTMKNSQRTEAEMQAMKASANAAPPAMSAAALMEAPPAAVSAGKQSKLNELLVRYKADKISAAEYHAERAKILAE